MRFCSALYDRECACAATTPLLPVAPWNEKPGYLVSLADAILGLSLWSLCSIFVLRTVVLSGRFVLGGKGCCGQGLSWANWGCFAELVLGPTSPLRYISEQDCCGPTRSAHPGSCILTNPTGIPAFPYSSSNSLFQDI